MKIADFGADAFLARLHVGGVPEAVAGEDEKALFRGGSIDLLFQRHSAG
jgi:hypothetical protein